MHACPKTKQTTAEQPNFNKFAFDLIQCCLPRLFTTFILKFGNHKFLGKNFIQQKSRIMLKQHNSQLFANILASIFLHMVKGLV